MDKSRNYILDRIRSKKTSIEEFNFDKLEAPPLSWFFSPFDIMELNSIARSLRYSAKPQERYDAINRVCNRCGLVKFAAGTNRVVYRHPEFQDILFKIAADDVGLNDNPCEYRNQFLLKPFVTKTFEISPCGTVAIVERVNPITSREEYISVADDVFELITEWLVGRYVLADIGSKFFMNIGVRKGFGVVLLDYPYVYELDGNKIFCRRPDPTSPTGKCEGEIDYDDGFNFLHCTKCGAIYKAKELEKKIKDNEIIVEREGEIKMKITVKGGSKNVNMAVTTEGINNDNFLKVKASIPTTVVNEDSNKDHSPKVIFNTNKEESPKIKVKKIEESTVVEDKVDNNVEIKIPEKTVNGVPSKIDVVQHNVPVSFSEDIQKEAIANKVDAISPVEEIDRAVNTILENLELINIDTVKNDSIIRVFDALAGKLPISSESFTRVIRLGNDIINDLVDDDYIKSSNDDELLELVKTCFNTKVKFTKSYERCGNDLVLTYESGIVNSCDEDDDPKFVLPSIEGTINLTSVFDNIDENDNPEKPDTISSIKFYDAKIIDVKEIFPNQQRQDIIVFTDENGDYAIHNGSIIAADTINDQSVQNVTTVSKKWIEDINRLLSENDEDTVNEDEGEDTVNENEEVVTESGVDEDVIEGNASTGTLPPSTNGITAEEFLKNLENGENSTEE